MKKITIITAAFLMIILAVAATYTYKTQSVSNIQTALVQSGDVYTCPMHPDVVQDKPGTCPKCGMDLVLKDEKKNTGDKSAMTCCMDKEKCKEMGCNMENCKENKEMCKDKCMMMKNDVKQDMKMDCGNMQSDCKKNGSCCDK